MISYVLAMTLLLDAGYLLHQAPAAMSALWCTPNASKLLSWSEDLAQE